MTTNRSTEELDMRAVTPMPATTNPRFTSSTRNHDTINPGVIKMGIDPTQTNGQLRSIVERIERMEEEKAAVAADIKEIYAEAKANGFDAKIIRKIIRLRKVDEAERTEEEEITDIYLAALGMLPLFAKRGGEGAEQ